MKIPPWLFTTERYKFLVNSDDYQYDYENEELPNSSSISNIDEFEMIVDISREWKYDNEGKSFPIDVYLFCLTNRQEVMNFSQDNEQYKEISDLLNGDGETLEIYLSSIGLALKNIEGINYKSKLWLKQVVPLEMSFSTKNSFNISEDALIAIFRFSYRGIFQEIEIYFESEELEWENLKSTVFDLELNFVNYSEECEMYIRKKEEIEKASEFLSDEHKFYAEKIKSLRSLFKTTFRNEDVDFEINPRSFFSFKEKKEIFKDIFIPNVLMFCFIKEFANFMRETEKVFGKEGELYVV